jgi:hypothetical protein
LVGVRAIEFTGLQGRLYDAGDADRNLVLQIEHIFERAIEAVDPKMCARFCFY